MYEYISCKRMGVLQLVDDGGLVRISLSDAEIKFLSLLRLLHFD